MKLELKIRNIVLIGAFNPLGFDRHFFVKNGMVSDIEIDEKSVFLPQISQLVTSSTHLTINPLQMIINAIKPDDKDDIPAKVASNLLTTSKGQIVTASGINFSWFLTLDSEQKMAEFSKKMCFNEANKIQASFFNTDDAHFGFYSSKRFEDSRMKLDVKPVKYKLNDLEDANALQFDFNFHNDYREPATEMKGLEVTLAKYSRFREESDKIISSIKF